MGIFICAEIGINHNGDIDLAKKLIDAAYVTGWDCVKFQKRTPEICIPDGQKNKLRQTPWGEMKYIDYKHKIEFKKYEYDLIDQYCKSKSMNWTASVWDLPSLDFILNYKIPFIKIPSAHLTNLELIEKTAKTRTDEVTAKNLKNELLEIAPSSNEDYFLVPRVVE